ncbi:recombinase family protein [Methylobacterium isbiliense]|uniref:recombinase family protein n=1 Tax=Methylobacterium isbiliense TaxID=315478 RepID=UPI00338DD0DE
MRSNCLERVVWAEDAAILDGPARVADDRNAAPRPSQRPQPSGAPRWSRPTIRGIPRNPTYTGQIYAQRTQYRAPTHRRSATHPIGRPHGSAVPQPSDTRLLVGQVPAVVSREHFCNGKRHSTFSHRATHCSARYTPAGQLYEVVCALLSEPEPLVRRHDGLTPW